MAVDRNWVRGEMRPFRQLRGLAWRGRLQRNGTEHRLYQHPADRREGLLDGTSRRSEKRLIYFLGKYGYEVDAE